MIHLDQRIGLNPPEGRALHQDHCHRAGECMRVDRVDIELAGDQEDDRLLDGGQEYPGMQIRYLTAKQARFMIAVRT